MYRYIFITILFAFTYAHQDPNKCDACKALVSEIKEHLDKECLKSTECIIERTGDFCEALATNNKGSARARVCEAIGALENSPTSIMRILSDPLKLGIPADRICEQKLNKADSQICEIRLERPPNLEGEAWKKQKVGDLKRILSGWGESCDGCIEKSEFIRRIEDLKPTHYTPPKDEL